MKHREIKNFKYAFPGVGGVWIYETQREQESQVCAPRGGGVNI